MGDAENHKAIAERIYPNLDVTIRIDGIARIGHPLSRVPEAFNLLETDSNGQPTQQAKASALDVLCWLNNGGLPLGYMLFEKVKDPCAAIYRAACEALELEEL